MPAACFERYGAPGRRRDARLAVALLLLTAVAAHAAAPLRPVFRVADGRYRSGGGMSTFAVPHVDVAGVQRFALLDGTLRPTSTALLWMPLDPEPGVATPVTVPVPEHLRRGPLCLGGVAVGASGEEQLPRLIADAGERETLDVRIEHPTDHDGHGGVLVRGSRPRHTRWVSAPIAIPRDARLRFSLGIATAPPPLEGVGMPSALIAASLMRGRDPGGAVYEQPPAVTPVHFRIEALREEDPDDARGPALFDETAGAEAELALHWAEREADLGAYADRRVRLAFEMEHCSAGPSPVWGDPTVVAPAEPSAPRPRNLLLISLDTLRADRLGCYGYRRATSPRIDARLAAQGALFEHAYAAWPETTGSHMTLLTSLAPCRHRVFRWGRILSADVPTLAERLRADGYDTGGFTEGGEVTATLGFSRGFATHVEANRKGVRRTTAAASGWIAAHGDTPWFAFVHTYQVHAPYEPPDEYVERLGRERGASASYDGEIRFTDDAIGDLIDGLPDPANTVIMLVADHGEHFGEHGLLGHGGSLFDVLLHVPLLVRAPGIAPAGLRVAMNVGLIDVVPTALDLLGLPPPAGVQGRSLVPLLRGETLPPVTLFAQMDDFWTAEGLVAARSPDLKLIIEPTRAEYAAFRFLADPREERDVAADVTAETARGVLAQFTGTCSNPLPAAPAEDLPPAVRDQLRALGYVD